jgi:hypothetical protein
MSEKQSSEGWKAFLDGFPWYGADNPYPLQAYSEFMPPLRTGINPVTGQIYPWVLGEEDPYGWIIPEREEEYQLVPGMENIGRQLMEHLVQLGTGTLPVALSGHGKSNLRENVFGPEELLSQAGKLGHERYVTLAPLALSKTKDDKGRIRWTFFGASEQGPEKPFWRSFFEAPGNELPEKNFLDLMQWIFREAYGRQVTDAGSLRSLGFRILASDGHFPVSSWDPGKLPSWTEHYLVRDEEDFSGVSYLLTFRPFGKLPSAVKEKYLSGTLHLLPFPGSLILWGVKEYIRLQEQLYTAIQIPMLRLVKRFEETHGIRVPQSGWLHQPKVPGEKAHILEQFILDRYIRTNRWDRFHRLEDSMVSSKEIDPVLETLFSTNLNVLDLYNKPMARNSQLFYETKELLLDGPRAGRTEIGVAALKIMEGGLFRYRFYFPPMNAGRHEVFWHRPLVAVLSAGTGKPVIAPPRMLSGYLTGYPVTHPDLSRALELWPRFRRRALHLAVLNNFDPVHDRFSHQTSLNLLDFLDSHELAGRPLEREYARRLIRIPKTQALEEWLDTLPERSLDPEVAKDIQKEVGSLLEPAGTPEYIPDPLTFHYTANREYEAAFWHQIYFLAHGEYRNKDNADVVLDEETRKRIGHPERDLHRLGNYLITKHKESIRMAGMEGLAEVGELPFRWETDFEFAGFGGWKANQTGTEYERNILVVIPGKNRSEAVVMADHYDTAYMEDVYQEKGDDGPRIAAAGADDNHSATATLLLAAPFFLQMAKEGKLERDIWLLHLTGEEFPSDCMGARDFAKHIVQRSLKMRLYGGAERDLSQVSVKGVYVMDMIAHNRDNDKDIFQISPGRTAPSLWLAYQAHLAARAWNAQAEKWNQEPGRKGLQRGKRSANGMDMPEKALFLQPEGEIRTWNDPFSSLYNTDGMIFSDTGIPVVLFMENYDIHRQGYHDMHDTMENIDLDYGSAVSAIAIESVARVATIK